MKKTSLLTLSAVTVASLTLIGCQSAQEKMSPDSLVAAYTSTAPNMAAGAADPIWANAKPYSAAMSGGANFGGKGESRVTLKAAYSNDMLYMLVQYTDPTDSVRRAPYQKQADGSWKMLIDAADKGGDNNVYYEDKWAVLWPTNEATAKQFDKEGCAMACHEGQTKPYGNKYTNQPGQLLDMWHMKGVRTAPWGLLHDQYTDDTRYDPKTAKNAGRKGDPGPAEYKGFGLVNGKPEFMNRDGKAANAGGTYYIKKGNEVAFDDSKFKAGDEVASILIMSQEGSDAGDVKIANSYANGVRTTVVSRKLVTGSKFDVQFTDLGKRYGFGFAAFDNAQVRHAMTDDPAYLVFAKK